MDSKLFTTIGLSALVVVTLLVGAVFFVPWQDVNWGKVEYAPANVITVTGSAHGQQNNQIARFSAGVMAVNEDKQKAIDEVNQKMTAIITAVKEFGIPEADIQTESLSVNQEEYYDDKTRRSTPSQWRANNSISVKLKEIDKASELTALLTNSGATNVYGPNFMVEETNGTQVELVDQAMQNAREKADAMAKASGRRLGKVVSVSESAATQGGPILFDAAQGRGGGGAPVQPGSTGVVQSVTVTFELR